METETYNPPPGDENAHPEPSAAERLQHAMTELETQGKKGAKWFYIIAALSLVNTAMIHLEGNVQFVVGLAISLITDAIAKVVGQQHPQFATQAMIVSICFSVFVSGMAILFGWLSTKRYNWVFGLGAGLYLLDGLLYLLLSDYMSAAFHAYALYGMIQGIRAFRQLRRLELAMQDANTDSERTIEPQFGLS